MHLKYEMFISPLFFFNNTEQVVVQRGRFSLRALNHAYCLHHYTASCDHAAAAWHMQVATSALLQNFFAIVNIHINVGTNSSSLQQVQNRQKVMSTKRCGRRIGAEQPIVEARRLRSRFQVAMKPDSKLSDTLQMNQTT